MAVCLKCGAHGFWVKVNEDGICSKCVKAMESYMTLDEAAEFIHNNDLNKVIKNNKNQKKLNKRENASFSNIFDKYNKALEFEKAGRLDKALSIYLSILKLNPKGTVYYERPCILLEKMHRYGEAISICEMAIEKIEARMFHAEVEPFYKRKARLEKKIEREANKKPKPTEEELMQFWKDYNEAIWEGKFDDELK